MIKAKQVFFWTSNLKGHHFLFDFGILFITVLPEKRYVVKIGPVHQKLWPIKCMMLKTLYSNFLDWENTLRPSRSF